MMTTIAVLLAVIVVLLLVLLARSFQSGGKQQFDFLSQNLERTDRAIRDEIGKNREELRDTLKGFGDSLQQGMDRVRESVAKRLDAIQQDNNQKLEQMRATVDEKLQSTLEKRLGESFKMVSERLEKVHQGLGEMQHLASGVGDLKKILTNVKTRGTWGEVQLGQLLEQILTPEQYDKNVVTKKGSKDPVEFAIRLPGKEDEVVLLPIDAKFPVEDYQRLQDAYDAGDKAALEEASKAVEARIKMEAKKIHEKYIDPPQTTDFAVMFLPTEGLYAEVINRPGLCDVLQRDYRIAIAGPTTIAALLNSLQMGFRTLAVEKRASEVWKQLIDIKTEFGKFGGLLEGVEKKLSAASAELGKVQSKSRNIERKLGKVQEIPVSEEPLLIESEQGDVTAE